MKLLLLVLLSLNVYAGDILTSYRNNGIADIEKQMDAELAKSEYWDKYLEDKDTTFGYIESYSNILTCDKSQSLLHLYSLDQNRSFKFKKTYNALTGKQKGDKIKEGDLRTPIGIYEITKKLSKDTKLDPFYGPLAFVTSYPNVYDSYRGKNGSGIWIHGLPLEESRDEFTRGCIAINNSNIECLDRNIDISKTLLIINDTEIKKSISKETLSLIMSQLFAWRHAWLYDDIKGYLGFYSTEFIRNDGMNIKDFTNYKTRIFKKVEKKTIIFNNINVLPYPNGPDVYQITFKEFYKSDTFEFNGDKTLIVKLNKNKNIQILTEK